MSTSLGNCSVCQEPAVKTCENPTCNSYVCEEHNTCPDHSGSSSVDYERKF